MLDMNRQNIQFDGDIRRRDAAQTRDFIVRRGHSHFQNRNVIAFAFA
jgi:hypothetical protein